MNHLTSKTMNTLQATSMLRNFVNQRPGFDLCNYGSMKDYRQDYNEALKDRNSFYELLELASDRYGANLDEVLSKHLTNTSGRLSLEGGKLQYITGQYFPTEYRTAACRALATIIWESYRGEKYEDGSDVYKDGHEMRAAIKRNWRIKTRNTKLYFS